MVNGKINKEIYKVNGITYDYVYDNNGNIKSIVGSDGFKVNYVSKKTETSEGKTIWYIYDGDGELIGFELNDKSYYYEKNLQGDITGIIDDKGVKVVTYRYDAWGKVISMEGDTELGKLNPFRYRSYYFDEEIGMYYLQSRYYDVEIGRFINADDVNLIPTMQTGIKGTNLFEYCDDNPVNKEDPSGHWPHFGCKWFNSRKWVARWIGLIFIAVGCCVSGFITKGITKGLKAIGKKAERQLRTRVQSKMKKVLLRLAANMGKSAAKKAFQNNVNKIIKIMFTVLGWRGYTLELGLAEALDRLDGKNDNYIFA